MLILASFLSTALMALVIVYGALMMSEKSSEERYLEYIEENKRKD